LPLYVVGGGLSAEYLTLKAIRLLSVADKVYVDTYTSIAPGIDKGLAERLNLTATVVEASRSLLEEGAARIVEEARDKIVVVLVPGDPHYATTHISLIVEARKRGIEAYMVPGVSGPQAAVEASGLQFYRFGRPVTLVYPRGGVKPYSSLDVIRSNAERGLHTLVLLDLDLEEKRAMTVPDAVRLLLELEEEQEYTITSSSVLVGIARAGLPDQKCVAGGPEELLEEDYPPPPHSLVVTAPRLHPMEAEALQLLCGLKRALGPGQVTRPH